MLFISVALLIDDLLYLRNFATIAKPAFICLAAIAFLESVAIICVLIWNKEIKKTIHESF